MTQEGQKNHNFPQSVRIWGRYDTLPSSYMLEQEMKKQEKPNTTPQDNNDKDQPKSVDQHTA